MKKINLLLSGIILILFASCKSDEDGLSLDNFKTTAIIQGNVFYSLGQDFVENKYLVDKRVKAKGKTIYLDIQSSEYKPGASGIITYTAVLDSAGNYSFTIPVKAQGTTSVTLRLEQFISQRKVFDEMNAGAPVFKSEDAVFSFTKTLSVSKGSLSVENISYAFTPVEIPDTYKEYITFNGKLNLAYEKGFRDGSLKSASGTSVEVTVNYPQIGNKHFGATVDQNGDYSVQIPVISKKESITASFLPVSYVANDYIHYTSATSQVTLSGIYAVSSSISKTTRQGLNEDIIYDLGLSTFYFDPFTVPSATWEANELAGWVQLDPTIYKYPITLTGGVRAAYEKSYLVGDYSPVAGKTVRIDIEEGNYGTQTYILATDNSGNFTLPIMLPSKNMNISVSVTTETYSVTNYTHYSATGTTTLNGWYDHSYFDISNKSISVNEFKTSYTLDNLYRQFTPADNSEEEWYTNLMGWYQIPNMKSSVVISGAIKKAVEGAPDNTKPNAWAIATWANATNQPFTIAIGGKTFVGITNTTGQYNLNYPLTVILDPTENNNLTIGVSSYIEKVSNFNHYADINTASPTQIQGSYSGYLAPATRTIVDGTTCTVKDCYMFFTPSTTPTGWSYYNWLTNN